jgi:hypothetical protein
VRTKRLRLTQKQLHILARELVDTFEPCFLFAAVWQLEIAPFGPGPAGPLAFLLAPHLPPRYASSLAPRQLPRGLQQNLNLFLREPLAFSGVFAEGSAQLAEETMARSVLICPSM